MTGRERLLLKYEIPQTIFKSFRQHASKNPRDCPDERAILAEISRPKDGAPDEMGGCVTETPQPAVAYDRAIVEAKLAAMPPDLATRMRELYNRWLAGEAKQFEIRELLLAGLIPDVANAGTGNRLCRQIEAAERLSVDLGKRIYQRDVSKMLSSWRNLDFYRKVVYHDGRIDYAELKRRWNGVSNGGEYSGPSGDEAKNRLALARAKREERRDEQEQRKFDSAWMLTAAAFFIMDSWGVTLKNALRDAIERQLCGEIEVVVNEMIFDEVLRQNILERMRPIFPAKFDSLQADMANKLDELTREAEELNKQQKEEMK